jgi:heptosyltransferase II
LEKLLVTSRALKKVPHNPRKVLVFQTAFLGDALLAIPLLKAIKFKWPNCLLGLVCRRGVGEILLHSGVVDEIIEVEKGDRASLKRAFKQTKEFHANVIVSPHMSFRTALWVRRLHPQFTIGFQTPWNFFAFTTRVRRVATDHDVLRQLSLVEALGLNLSDLPSEIKTLDLEVEGESNFKFAQDYAVLSPGSQWNTKKWSLEGFIEVGKKLESTGLEVVIVGTASENEVAFEIVSKLQKPVNLCGKTTVFQLAQVLKGAKILFCNDSGTMHVASTVGTPLVSVFGPTVPSQGYAPWNKKARVVEVSLDCRPCGAHGHDKCPIGTHDCMKKVSSEMVWAKGEELLRK